MLALICSVTSFCNIGLAQRRLNETTKEWHEIRIVTILLVFGYGGKDYQSVAKLTMIALKLVNHVI